MTTGSADRTNKSALLKVRYQKGLNFRGVATAKFYNMASKDTSFSERNKERVISVTAGNGGSADFPTALALRGPGTEVTFTLVPKPDYVILSIDEQLFRTKNAAAIKNIVTQQLDNKGKEHGYIIARKAWGENGGSLGRLSATASVTTTTLTFRSMHQIRNMYKGMVIEAAATDGTAQTPGNARAGSLTVASINIASKTIVTTVAGTTGIPGLTASDYIFPKGEFGKSWSGLLGWCPVTAPTTGDYFYGIDRSAYGDTAKLSGFRASATLADKSSNVVRALAEASPLEINVNTLFCNPVDYAKWLDELGDNRRETEVSAKTVGVSYKGILVHTPSGDVTVLSEPRCPENIWVATSLDAWEFNSIGEVPSMPGPNEWERESTADARQARLASYMFLDCEDPGATVVGAWS